MHITESLIFASTVSEKITNLTLRADSKLTKEYKQLNANKSHVNTKSLQKDERILFAFMEADMKTYID